MNTLSFEVCEVLLAQYKHKKYQELRALPDETDLHHKDLPVHDTLRLIKTTHADHSLKISIRYEHHLTNAEYEEQQASMRNMLKATAASPQEAEKSIRNWEKYTPKFPPHPTNPNLLSFSSVYQPYFDIHPDGTVIEDEATRNQKAEDEMQEEAPWFGTTGLDEETEREVPRYLRLEYGEFILDEDSLKARDLTYLGRFQLTAKELEEGDFASDTVAVHFWRYPASGSEPAYAYVEEWDNGDTCIGMGSYFPTKT